MPVTELQAEKWGRGTRGGYPACELPELIGLTFAQAICDGSRRYMGVTSYRACWDARG